MHEGLSNWEESRSHLGKNLMVTPWIGSLRYPREISMLCPRVVWEHASWDCVGRGAWEEEDHRENPSHWQYFTQRLNLCIWGTRSLVPKAAPHACTEFCYANGLFHRNVMRRMNHSNICRSLHRKHHSNFHICNTMV